MDIPSYPSPTEVALTTIVESLAGPLGGNRGFPRPQDLEIAAATLNNLLAKGLVFVDMETATTARSLMQSRREYGHIDKAYIKLTTAMGISKEDL